MLYTSNKNLNGGGSLKKGIPPTATNNSGLIYNHSRHLQAKAGMYSTMNSNLSKTQLYYYDILCNSAFPVLYGFDLVEAYKHNNGLMKNYLGNKKYTQVYNGYIFWFKNIDNKKEFIKNSSTYIPACGGFCAWSVSEEGWKTPLYGLAKPNAKSYSIPQVYSPKDGGSFIKINKFLYCFEGQNAENLFKKRWKPDEVFTDDGGNRSPFVPKSSVENRITALNAVWDKTLNLSNKKNLLATVEQYNLINGD